MTFIASLQWLGPYLIGIGTGLGFMVYQMGGDVWPLIVALVGATCSYYVHTKWL